MDIIAVVAAAAANITHFTRPPDHNLANIKHLASETITT